MIIKVIKQQIKICRQYQIKELQLQKQDLVMDNKDQRIVYHFIKQLYISFGEAVYILGSVKELGQGQVQKAIRMSCRHNKFWIAEIQIPINIHIQYKYFIGKFQLHNNYHTPIQWQGSQHQNLIIDDKQKAYFLKNNFENLSIMSFNVRFQSQKDKGEYSWDNRKENVVQLIKDYYPDIIGVQEPKKNQRVYMEEYIKMYYRYYGKARDLADDEESGIFIRKDKFLVLEDGYIWINEHKIAGQKGFQARLPRYYTYLIVAPLNQKAHPFIVINTHLDHETPLSRLEGIKYISETLNIKSKEYNLKGLNCFVMGDFNTSDDNQIFKWLKVNGQQLKSMRYILPKQKSSFQATFNGFSKILNIVDKTFKFFNLDPGATIDHIFVKSQSYTPISFKIVKTQTKIVSDHYPIIGQFTIKAQLNLQKLQAQS